MEGGARHVQPLEAGVYDLHEYRGENRELNFKRGHFESDCA